MKSWDELKAGGSPDIAQFSELSTITVPDSPYTWEKLNAKNPLESLKGLQPEPESTTSPDLLLKTVENINKCFEITKTSPVSPDIVNGVSETTNPVPQMSTSVNPTLESVTSTTSVPESVIPTNSVSAPITQINLVPEQVTSTNSVQNSPVPEAVNSIPEPVNSVPEPVTPINSVSESITQVNPEPITQANPIAEQIIPVSQPITTINVVPEPIIPVSQPITTINVVPEPIIPVPQPIISVNVVPEPVIPVSQPITSDIQVNPVTSVAEPITQVNPVRNIPESVINSNPVGSLRSRIQNYIHSVSESAAPDPELASTVEQVQQLIPKPPTVVTDVVSTAVQNNFTSRLNINLVKYVHTPKINFTELMAEAAAKAVAQRNNAEPEMLADLQELPSIVQNNTRIMDTFDASVQELQRNRAIEENARLANTTVNDAIPTAMQNTNVVPEVAQTQNDTIQREITNVSQNNPSVGSNTHIYDALSERARALDPELSRIEKAGQAIQAKGQLMLDYAMKADWYHSAGFWVSVAALSGAAMTYLGYRYKLPIIHGIVNKIFPSLPEVIKKDLIPSNTFTPSTPINVSPSTPINISPNITVGGGENIIDSLTKLIAAATVFTATFMKTHGSSILNHIVNNVRKR